MFEKVVLKASISKIALNAPRVTVNRAGICEMDQTTGPHARRECVNLANMENKKIGTKKKEEKRNRLDLLIRFFFFLWK